MASNICWGVEVGAGAVKAVKLQRDGDDVKVLDFALIPHKRVLSTPETNERDAKVIAIGQLLAAADLTKQGLAVSIPGHSAFAKFAKLPPADPKSIPALVKFEAAQQIPFPIDEVEWDFQTFASPDSPDVEAGIFAVTREKVTDVLSLWTDIKCAPQTLTLSPLAAYNAIAYDQMLDVRSPAMVIIDVGTISTDLIVADSGRLWIRTFPIGGHQFTEALVTAFNLSYVKAEKLKREAESSQHARHVLQAMRPVFADLAQDVQRSMNYYQSLHPEAKLTKVIGLGATFNLPGLRKFLSQQLGIEVGRLESFTRAKVAADKEKDFQANAMCLATAYGLALQGLGMQTVSANLMPAAVVRETMWEGKTRWFITAAALGLAAGGAAFIGPLRDSLAAPSGSKPVVIDEVKRQIKSMKNEWDRVDKEYKPDYRAAASLTMLSDREIHAMLLADTAAIMNRLEADVAKQSPGGRVTFRKVDMFYLTGNQTANPSEPTRGGAGSGAGGSALGGERAAPAGGEAPAGDAAALNPRVELWITIAVTNVPDVNKHLALVKRPLTAWLEENSVRKDKPYIFDKTVLPQKRGQEMIPGTTPGGPGGNPLNPPAPPMPGGPGGGPMRLPGGGMGGEGPGSPPPMNPPGGGSGAPTDLDQLAPIPPATPLGDPGSTLVIWQFRIEAKIQHSVPGEKKEGGQ